MNETITYVGLDVHKETIAVALADVLKEFATETPDLADCCCSALS